MRSTLFFIPHEFAGMPLFGFGWALIAIAIGCASWVAWTVFNRGRQRANGKEVDLAAEILTGLPIWIIAAAMVVFLLPNVEQRLPGASPEMPPIVLGLPIRGYGVMVLLGLLSGIGITVHRGRSLGISSDFIVGLGFWMMLGGVVGARSFYVIQKWDEFSRYAFGERLVAIIKLTEGGLVIYGGVIGGIVAGCVYCLMNRKPVRAFGDLIAPAFLIGYSFGRIGCLLNGCCFGGICTESLPTIQFPQGSGPYMVQLESGKLLGLELSKRPSSKEAWPATVARVAPASLAEAAGIEPGDTITKIRPYQAAYDAQDDPAAPPKVIAEVGVGQSTVTFMPAQLPPRSLPVHPSQIYAAVNAALLCWLIWCLQPWPRWDGMTFLVAILLYAISRFLIEGIRSDEGGQLGTSLSISQWISVAGGGTAILLMLLLARTTPSRAWNWRQASNRNG